MEGENSLSQVGEILHFRNQGADGQRLMEILPPFQKILLLTEEGGRIARIIDISSEKEVLLPSWWETPFPLVALQGKKICMNHKALELCSGGKDAFTKALESFSGEGEEYIFSCTFQNGEERRFFAKKIEKHIFSLEDISSEMHMAEDIVWWAAVGNALTAYLEAKGVGVQAFHEKNALPEQKKQGETIPCRWEGELLGYIKLSFDESFAGEEEVHEGKACNGNSL